MSKFFDTLKKDSTQAAYRIAGTQVIKATKAGLLNVLRRKGVNNKHINSVSNFLDTELGTAGLSTAVGLMLSHLPSFKNDKRAQSIAEEFRVGGLALAGNILASKAIQDFLPKVKGLVDNLPISNIPLLQSPKIRVEELTTAPVYEELEEEKVSDDINSLVWH
jgi:hypothetical protein